MFVDFGGHKKRNQFVEVAGLHVFLYDSFGICWGFDNLPANKNVVGLTMLSVLQTDWQTLISIAIVFAAILFLLQKTFSHRKSGCAQGCGSCSKNNVELVELKDVNRV